MRHPGLILLAAGASSRMGEPKQLLPWGDTTLLKHACLIALQTPCRPVVVVLGNAAERCRESCEDLPLLIVVNPDWAQGLGSSLAAGIAALAAAEPDIPGVLIMLADQPALSPARLETLLAAWQPPAWPIAAMAYGSDGGVPAVFDRSYFPELLSLREDRGAKALIAREKSRVVLVEAADDLVDVDTPATYRDHRPNVAVSNRAGDFTD